MFWTFPTFAARCLDVHMTREIHVAKGGNLWARIVTGNFASMPTSTEHFGIFYMPQIYDMGPTTLLPHPKEGALRIFRP